MCQRLAQKVLDNEVCHQGDVDFYLSLSPSPSPFPVQVPLHIWISPPADKEQGSGWREDGGVDWE